jgi:hypothetical protein
MTMRVGTLMMLALLAALAPACKSRRPVPVDTSEAGEIPREVALQKLRELLPTAEFLYCTAPKETVKGSDVRGLIVQSSMLEIDHGRGKRLTLTYVDISIVNLEQVGKYYTARVYTAANPDRELFGFQWRQEDPAKRAVELLASLKKK